MYAQGEGGRLQRMDSKQSDEITVKIYIGTHDMSLKKTVIAFGCYVSHKIFNLL